MAARPLKIALVVLVAFAVTSLVGCGGSPAGTSSVGSAKGLRGSGDAEARHLRDSVVRGLERDFAEGTRVGGPAFESCLDRRLRKALDRPTLAGLVQVYRRPTGQPYAAQALNILAEPLAVDCGHRHFVPEMVNASRGLRGGKPAGAAVRKLGVTYGPYLGVRCLRAGHIACDRVGIDIVFRRAATGVVAVIGERHLRLRTPGMHSRVPRHDWVGTLTDAGLATKGSPLAIEDPYGPQRWSGSPPVYVPVELRVTYASGRRAHALFAHVFLSPGWG